MTTAASFVFILQHTLYQISVLCIFTLQSTLHDQSYLKFFLLDIWPPRGENTVLSWNVRYLSPSGTIPYPRRMDILNRE